MAKGDDRFLGLMCRTRQPATASGQAKLASAARIPADLSLSLQPRTKLAKWSWSKPARLLWIFLPSHGFRYQATGRRM